MTHPSHWSRFADALVIRRLSLRAPTRVIFYSGFCLLSLIVIVSIEGDLTIFVATWYFALICVAAPIFFVSDLAHPLIVNLYWHFLLLTNFYHKHVSGEHLIYAPRVPLADVHWWLSYALAIYVVWYLSMLAGYRLGMRIPLGRASVFPLSLRIRRPTSVAVALAVVSVLAFLSALWLMGGSLESMLNAMGNRAVAYRGHGYLSPATQLGAVAAVILLYRGEIGWSVMLLLVTMAETALFGGRAAVVVGLLIPYLMAYYYHRRRLSLPVVAGLAFLTLVFVVGWGSLRASGEWRADATDVTDLFIQTARAPAQAENVPAMVWGLHTGAVEYQGGRTILNGFLGIVPRALWPGKPEATADAVLLYELTGSTGYGLPAGPYGIAYFNFGWAGVVPLGLAAGLLVCLYYRWFRRRMDSGRWNRIGVVLYPFVVLNIFNIFDGGGFIPIVFSFGSAVVILILLNAYHRLSDDQSAQESRRASHSRRRSGRSRRHRTAPEEGAHRRRRGSSGRGERVEPTSPEPQLGASSPQTSGSS